LWKYAFWWFKKGIYQFGNLTPAAEQHLLEIINRIKYTSASKTWIKLWAEIMPLQVLECWERASMINLGHIIIYKDGRLRDFPSFR